MRLSLVLASVILVPVALGAQVTKPQPKEEPPKRQTEPPKTAVGAAGDSLTIVMPQALKARSIGPAVMGGRVSSIALDPTSPTTFYVGLATGGVMKTTDGGASFQGIFDKEGVAAIGAVAVARSDSSVVWVGTGEANDRNSTSWGNGVYRSTDAGATWQHVGLDGTRSIARIVVHPTDPKTAWVAAAGDLWTPSAERGCYKTSDGGRSWKKVLAAAAPNDTRVGCGDIAIDPSNPSIVYAALYARRRLPWSFISGVAASEGKDAGGIFRSADGGTTWTKLAGGLPTHTQRIGLAVYAKDPKIVYAIVQSDEGGQSSIDDPKSKHGGVFRSADGGTTWTRQNALDPRPFYFSQIRVDPTNDQKVYVLGYMLHVSEDGGRSFREDRFKNVHSDNHDLAIDPRTPSQLLLGTDGGVYRSLTGGEGWEHLSRFAGGEFYRVSADSSTPYRVCGGLQDNSSWVGPSAGRSKDGITNGDWTNLGGGDGGYCFFDATDHDIVYVESQQGFAQRTNLRTGEIKSLRPEPTEGQPAFRFHWSAPLVPSLHEAGTFYFAGNRVFKLTDHGDSWQPISPDLSTQELTKMSAVGSGAEDYGVVYTLAESPRQAGLLWAGTDDGKVWKTEDGGGTWTDLTASLPAAAKGIWVSRIEASAHDPKVAYAAFDGHRTGSYASLAYRTIDGGRTWQSVTGNLPNDAPVKVVREDIKNASVLYAGTEFGLYVSVDRGRHWSRFGEMPTVSVDDIIIHPRDLDLIVATHGRSLFVVDDIRPLEEFTAAVRDEDAHLFTIRPAHASYLLPGWADSQGSAEFRGVNPAEGALISFWVRQFTGDPVSIAVSDSTGHPVANLTGAGTPGINRVSWDLKPTKDLLTEYGGEGQKFVRGGEYTVTLTYGKVKQTRKLRVDVPAGMETR